MGVLQLSEAEKLVRRALAGDVDAMIEILVTLGELPKDYQKKGGN